MELKQGVALRVPVTLITSATGAPMTGVAFGAVVCYLQKQAGAAAPKVVDGTNWFELDSVNMPGEYDLLLSSGDIDTPGFLRYSVATSTSQTYRGLMEVVANIESDTYTRIGAPAVTSIADDLQTAITSIKGTSDKDLTQIDTAITDAITSIKGTSDKDLTQIDTAISTIDFTAITDGIIETLGMLHKNSVIMNQIYNAGGRLTQAELRVYDTSAHAVLNDGITGLLKTYTIYSTYDLLGHETLYRLTAVP